MNQTTIIVIAIALGALLVPNAIVSMSTLSKQGQLEALVQAHTKSGQVDLKAGKIDRAEAAFRTALALDATDQAARLGLTASQASRITTRTESVSRGDAVALSYQFENALKDDPKRAELYLTALGAVATALTDFDGAQAWYEKATAPESASSNAWAARGAFELSRNKLDQASTSLAKAIKLDGENAKARLSHGIVLKKQKKYAEAVSELEKAVSKLPGPKVWYELGDSHLRNGKFEPAYNAFVSAAKVHTSVNREPSLLKRLGVTAYRLKKYTEAIKYLTQATQLDKDPEVLLNLGIAYQASGNHTAAGQHLAKVVQERPAHAEARAYLMKSLVQINQIAAARKIGRQYLALSQNRPAMKAGAEIIKKMLGQLNATQTKKPQAARPAKAAAAPLQK